MVTAEMLRYAKLIAWDNKDVVSPDTGPVYISRFRFYPPNGVSTLDAQKLWAKSNEDRIRSFGIKAEAYSF